MIKFIVFVLILLNGGYFAWLIHTGSIFYTPPTTYEEGVQKLVLLPPSESIQPSSNQHSCYAVGPFDTKRSAALVSNKVNELGFWTEVTSKETMQVLNYFVYLQPFATREDALAVIAEISKYEIKQYNLIENGAYQNAIGLGSFTNIDQARRHAEYVRFLGYDARYTKQKTYKEVYWVNYDVPAEESVPVLSWAKEINQKNHPLRFPQTCLDT